MSAFTQAYVIIRSHKMIFFKQKNKDAQVSSEPENPSPSDSGLKSRLKKTRSAFTSLFKSTQKLDDGLLDDLEDHLIMADMGIDAVDDVMTAIRPAVKSKQISSVEQLIEAVTAKIEQLLNVSQDELRINQKPFVLLLVGVNGVGKTTTAARLANYYKCQHKSVMMAACDTFRAAAIEQLQQWGTKLDVPVIAQEHGADSAAVAHDAYKAASARNIDILIIDTAGRQHTHSSLMDQLGKVNRVLEKLDPALPHETIIVLDAGNGQNALSQVSHFNEMTPLTGLVVTKLDGTAKGGVMVALAKKFKLPVRFIGIGESMEDLMEFNARDFSRALLPDNFSDKA